MKKVVFIIALLFSVIVLAQSNEIVPIILDGKPAFLNVTTGKVVTKEAATSKKYKKIKLNGFSSTVNTTPNNANFSTEEGAHTVSSGETLYAISRKYGLSVSALKRLNNLSSNILSVGQVLQIQKIAVANTTIETNQTLTHTVSSGKTLYAISRKYNITVAKIMDMNNLLNNTISIGQELIVQ